MRLLFHIFASKLKNQTFVKGSGPSKKDAEQNAALNLLKSIKKNELDRWGFFNPYEYL